MAKPVVFMFSGQGSQYYHMGKELFELNPVFRKWMLKLDDIVGEIIGESVIDRIYDKDKGKSGIFDRTLYSHPAIFMVEYSLAQVVIEDVVKPDYVLGASLGEFIAAAIAGVMNYEEVLSALIRHAEIVETHCEKGGMLTILDDPRLYNDTPFLYENSELAAVNFNSHFVVSGRIDRLEQIERFLEEKDIIYQELPVSQGFHSTLMDPATSIYADYLIQKSFQPPKIPFISCSCANIVTSVNNDHLVKITRKPIEFQKTVHELEKKQNYIYLDLGPSGTLANFVKYNLTQDSQSESFDLLNPFGRDLRNLEQIREYLHKNNFFRPKMKRENMTTKVKKMTTFVFPGQGSQKKGMGGALFDDFKELTAKADAILGYSIKELCMEDIQKRLGKTQYTQPALFVVNALTYLKKIEDNGRKLDFVAGHSLGEYNALFAAGVFDFEIGLKLVKKKGEVMGHAVGGGMAAVIGLSEEEIEYILKENGLENINIANYNTPSQIVISGLCEDIDQAKNIFETAGAKLYVPLNVSGAFHTPFMNEAKQEFVKYLKAFKFAKIGIPVISNVNARHYKESEVKEILVEQITSPVRWTESIRYLMGKGEMVFEEIGPGKVLTGLIKQIQKEEKPLVIEDEEKDVEMGKVQKTVKERSSKDKMPSLSKKDEKVIGQENKQKPSEEISSGITAGSLGDEEFKKEYNVKYAYVAGGMFRGIASRELVVIMGKAGLLGYFGTGGLDKSQIEEEIQNIQKELSNGQAYGMNLLSNPDLPQIEDETVDLYLKYGVKNIEASAYLQMTPALVRYRLKGLIKNQDGSIFISNKILAKVSRPEVAEAFLSPAPERIVKILVEENKVAQIEADLSKEVPMADDLCVVADSGGHTDQGVAYALMPAMLKLRDEMMKRYMYSKKVRIGAAGGIGIPEAAAAAFIMGADFILTGSINQCTVEAGTSDVVKDLLEQINVQDTEYVPAGDMFEMGTKIQVLKRGLFFPVRANKLYDLYRQHNSLDEIDKKTKKQIQEKYFKRSFEEIYEEVKTYYPTGEIERAERNPKNKMALIFRWYFTHTMNLALSGSEEQKVDYQVHCGPALGAFNQWVRGTEMESWKNRHVDLIAEEIMQETAEILNKRFQAFT